MPDDQSNDMEDTEGTSPDWSQFNQRLASFGLGETRDPLTTRTPASGAPAANRRRGDRSGSAPLTSRE